MFGSSSNLTKMYTDTLPTVRKYTVKEELSKP